MRKDDINKEIMKQLEIRDRMEEMGYINWAELGRKYGISKEAVRQRLFRIQYKLLKLKEHERD